LFQGSNLRGFHQPIYDRGGEAGGAHGGGEGDEDVDLLVELRVYTESGESLGCALAEADIADCLGLGAIEDVMDGIGDVVPSEIIYAVFAQVREADLNPNNRDT
jgi:hypothetical protein